MPSSEREYLPWYYTVDGIRSDNYHSCKYVQLSTGDTLEGLLQNAPTMHYAIDDAASVCSSMRLAPYTQRYAEAGAPPCSVVPARCGDRDGDWRARSARSDGIIDAS